ncbi:Oxidoreductase [Tulasnella sp. 330]|nr:Oxidoreductase [Tulasnella sp. 330]KAG8886074.1 Oxidoreductase [Tulasnella sp. 331]KAG8890247.1 Oxidoreductase [Tulasnella sp. 332]
MLRTGLRAISPRALLVRSRPRIVATANRLAHSQASSTSGASSSRVWVLASVAAVVGFYGLTLSTRDRLYMEDHSKVKKAPAVVETKATEFEEVAAEEPSPSDTANSSDSDTPSQDEEGQHEDSGSAAFNPETGEINWDCPCLGGMAHGPCGEEFREAFSCFVYSEGEPKGIECVEKFKGMQDCFRAHPEHYGAELDDDDDEREASVEVNSDLPEGASASVEATLLTEEPPSPTTPEPAKPKPKRKAKAKAESISSEAVPAEAA